MRGFIGGDSSLLLRPLGQVRGRQRLQTSPEGLGASVGPPIAGKRNRPANVSLYRRGRDGSVYEPQHTAASTEKKQPKQQTTRPRRSRAQQRLAFETSVDPDGEL
ncbi:hypothetical protein MRX96_042268 [Rhipicephalus microplus]